MFSHGLTELIRFSGQLFRMETPPCEARIIVVTAYDEIAQACERLMADREIMPKRMTGLEIIVSYNRGRANNGIASSIRRGILSAENANILTERTSSGSGTCGKERPTAEYDFFVQADQPYLNADLLYSFLTAFLQSGRLIGTMTCGGVPRSPNIFSAKLREELKALRGEHGGKDVWRAHSDELFFWPVEEEAYFTDIDTREDYAHENV